MSNTLLSVLCDGMPWEAGPPLPDASIDQVDQQILASVYAGVLAAGGSDVVEPVDPDLSDAIREAIVASTCSDALATYLGEPAVFTRLPTPADAPYPMVTVVNTSGQEEDGINDFRPILSYQIAVHGSNEVPAHYRTVSQIAFCLRRLFHRQHNIEIEQWGTVDQRCMGPVDQPSAGQTTTRVLTLNVRIAQLTS